MKAMRSKWTQTLKRTRDSPPTEPADISPETRLDTPEANAVRSVRLFCESGGPNNSGDEVLHLPTIVESAESSPVAAKECAQAIRRFLGKENYDKPYIQYNSIMLIRILADNPGKTFTRNIDAKLVQTVKELLRVGRDPSVKQILIETLNMLSGEKAGDEGLDLINEMWKKERERMAKIHGPNGPPQMVNYAPFDPNSQQNYFARNHRSRRLPIPHELASRIEEARISANLLTQVVQSTPPDELLQNELIREFADRCQSAQRSVQAYIVSENPAPDNDTMETLIETNEQLSRAQSMHQRAILNARKIMGVGSAVPRTDSGSAPPPGPPPRSNRPRPNSNVVSSISPPDRANKIQPNIPPPGEVLPNFSDDEEDACNPFADPAQNGQLGPSRTKITLPPASTTPTLDIEPYHPQFQGTQSYLSRQDSSANNATMHAAVSKDDERPTNYGAAKAGSKAPVYRY
ncbi:hypothetical protein BJ878DRAFT_512377 [Calycina marina]|uniref:GAT domain-containing protein n=1 Tax=Calycina marina TaxID=1763456 RepID=A0A9P7Z007_9HELO|nr:hypothetical protein BJ878DRAFT_512377 [Calycina marina]